MFRYKLYLLCLIFISGSVVLASKYSKQANEPYKKYDDYKKHDGYKKHDEYKKPDKYKSKSYEEPKKYNEPYKSSQPNKHEHQKTEFFDEPEADIRRINKPFRMAKLNLVWTKAQSVSQVIFFLLDSSRVLFFINFFL